MTDRIAESFSNTASLLMASSKEVFVQTPLTSFGIVNGVWNVRVSGGSTSVVSDQFPTVYGYIL